MADLDLDFDPSSVDAAPDMSALPIGEYVAQIIESVVAPAKTGNGMRLNFTWQVVEGEYVNRLFWQGLNYKHESAQAQMISQQQLKSICDAVGYTDHLTDSEVLHFIPCRVKVGFDRKNPERNEVKSVKPLQADAPVAKPTVVKTAATQAATKPATTQATKPPAGQTRPWGNRKTA